MNSSEVEFYMARHFCWRRNLIVPNVYWGLGFNYELDLMVVTPSRWAYEVEIKVSASDLKRDKFKRDCAHNSNKIRKLFFAMPKTLEKYVGEVPERAGIFLIGESGHVKLFRAAKLNKSASQLSVYDHAKLLDLAAMRVWTLKQALLNKRPKDSHDRL